MPQAHDQYGMFHITTNAKDKMRWCTLPGVPEILIDNLCMTKNIKEAQLIAFCVLPDHMHIIISPGDEGLSEFMRSFKRNSAWDIGQMLGIHRSAGSRTRAAGDVASTNIVAGNGTDLSNFNGWQRGFHDELIRDEIQLQRAITYVQENALKHNLVDDPMDWPWSSFHFEHLLD